MMAAAGRRHCEPRYGRQPEPIEALRSNSDLEPTPSRRENPRDATSHWDALAGMIAATLGCRRKGFTVYSTGGTGYPALKSGRCCNGKRPRSAYVATASRSIGEARRGGDRDSRAGTALT